MRLCALGIVLTGCLALAGGHGNAVTTGDAPPAPFFGDGGADRNGGLDPRLLYGSEAAQLAPFHPTLAPLRPTRFHPVQPLPARGGGLFTLGGVPVPGSALVLVAALGGIYWLSRKTPTAAEPAEVEGEEESGDGGAAKGDDRSGPMTG